MAGALVPTDAVSPAERAGQYDSEIDPQISEGLLIDEGPPAFTLAHGQVKLTGIDKPVSYTASVPANLELELAHILVPGFGGFKRPYRAIRDTMSSQENILTISYDPSRQSVNPEDPQQIHADTVSAIAQDLPNNKMLAEVLDGRTINLSLIALILHSMGSIAGTRHALSHPGETALLTYLESIGMEDPKSWRFIRRLPSSVPRELVPGLVMGGIDGFSNVKAPLRVANYFLSNLGQTKGEITSCHEADLRPSVIELGVLGVKRAMLYGGKDRLVPAELAIEGAGHLVDHCEVAPELDHFGPQKKPRETAAYIGNISRKFLLA